MTVPSNDITRDERIAARVAGAAGLASVAGITYANFGLRGPLLVSGSPAETIGRIASSPGVFRASILLDVAYVAGVVVGLVSLHSRTSRTSSTAGGSTLRWRSSNWASARSS